MTNIIYKSINSHKGYTLLEVLVSIFVLSVGLISILLLLTTSLTIASDTKKADRIATCSQVAIKNILIQDWLNRDRWDITRWTYENNNPVDFLIIDPNGISHGVSPNIMGIPRTSLLGVITQDYTLYNDLIFDYDYQGGERPKFYDYSEHYTWFATVCDKQVTAVSCYKRTFEEQVFNAVVISSLGGCATLSVSPNITVKKGQFLLIMYSTGKFDWYKVDGMYDGNVSISGADIPSNIVSIKCIQFDGVVGICRKTIFNEL